MNLIEDEKQDTLSPNRTRQPNLLEQGVPSNDRQLLTKKLMTSENEPILRTVYEGTVLQCKGGHSTPLLLDRWGVLTSSEFKYFKTRFSTMFNEKPLMVLSIDKIRGVRTYNDKKMHYLEIETKEEEVKGKPGRRSGKATQENKLVFAFETKENVNKWISAFKEVPNIRV